MFDKVYELSLNKGYVRHWGLAEACRELIQNALDSGSPFEYQFRETEGHDGSISWTFCLKSAGVTLAPNTLLLGTTSKAEATDKIGSFGEGYKIAMLVLTRLGHEVIIRNGALLWVPFFRHNKTYGEDLLCFKEDRAGTKTNDLEFMVYGLDATQVQEVRDSCLKMQEILGEIKRTKFGDILIERPGKLYVGSLYICDTDLKYGYDMHPRYITLERDRKTVSSWDLKSVARDMWYDTQEWDRVAQMIQDEVPDMEYAQWSSPELVKEACYRLFRSKNPGKLVATSQTQLQDMVKKGMTETVYVGGNFGSMVAGSISYHKNMTPLKVETPHDILCTWYAESKFHMHEKVRGPFQKILDQAKGWKL